MEAILEDVFWASLVQAEYRPGKLMNQRRSFRNGLFSGILAGNRTQHFGNKCISRDSEPNVAHGTDM